MLYGHGTDPIHISLPGHETLLALRTNNALLSIDIDGKAQNILLVGNDSRAGATPAELKALATEDDGGATNTDTMIVLHVPADGSKATLISFPRDMYVPIPGYGRNKINAAYSFGGPKLTVQTLEQLLDTRMDHVAMIDFEGFIEAIKQIDHFFVSVVQLPSGRQA